MSSPRPSWIGFFGTSDTLDLRSLYYLPPTYGADFVDPIRVEEINWHVLLQCRAILGSIGSTALPGYESRLAQLQAEQQNVVRQQFLDDPRFDPF